MPILSLTDEQVEELVRQLPRDRQEALVRSLLLGSWDKWRELSVYATDRARVTARERGLDWDTMTDAEHEEFVDSLLHEDR